MVAVAIPIVSLGLPILEVAVAVFRRFLSCRRLFAPDREHIHHKLLGRGLPHKQTVLVLYGVSACFCLGSLLLLNPGGAVLAIVLSIIAAGVLIGFSDDDDWFEYRLLNDPRFHARIAAARSSLRAGKGMRLRSVDFD